MTTLQIVRSSTLRCAPKNVGPVGLAIINALKEKEGK